MAGRGAAASPADRAASAAALRGRLELSEGADPSNGTVLFVIARSGASGPPLAVRRLAPGPFPLEFEPPPFTLTRCVVYGRWMAVWLMPGQGLLWPHPELNICCVI